MTTTQTTATATKITASECVESFSISVGGNVVGFASRNIGQPTFSCNTANGSDMIMAPTTIEEACRAWEAR